MGVGSVLVAFLVATGANTHELNTSYAMIAVRQDTLLVQFAIDSADIAAGFVLSEVEPDSVGSELLQGSIPQISEYVQKQAGLKVGGEVVEWPRPRGIANERIGCLSRYLQHRC